MNNSIYTIKFRLSRAMLLVLISAFLSVQWTTAHIHLEERHDHGGSHHLHDIEAHAHQSITQADNSNNSVHLIDGYNVKVVEIDHECNTKSENHLDDYAIASTSVNYQLNLIPLKDSIESSEFINAKQRYLDYSTIHLRAPPKFS